MEATYKKSMTVFTPSLSSSHLLSLEYEFAFETNGGLGIALLNWHRKGIKEIETYSFSGFSTFTETLTTVAKRRARYTDILT